MECGFHKEENGMKCVVCRQGEVQPGTATVTLEKDGLTLVVKKVPARVCRNCGEEYIDEDITRQLFLTAEKAAEGSVKVEIRDYMAA